MLVPLEGDRMIPQLCHSFRATQAVHGLVTSQLLMFWVRSVIWAFAPPKLILVFTAAGFSGQPYFTNFEFSFLFLKPKHFYRFIFPSIGQNEREKQFLKLKLPNINFLPKYFRKKWFCFENGFFSARENFFWPKRKILQKNWSSNFMQKNSKKITLLWQFYVFLTIFGKFVFLRGR